MIPEDRLTRLDEIITRARATGNTEALAKAVSLLARVVRQNAAEAAQRADAMTRSRTRERDDGEDGGDGLHKLRKGRDRCTATRRDGGPCQAPAIEGALVCRRHGGAAPQVRIAAEHLRYQMAAYSAARDFEETRGTPREFDALCKASQAERDLDAYEVKLRLLAELKAEVKRRRAAAQQAGPAPGQHGLSAGGEGNR